MLKMQRRESSSMVADKSIVDRSGLGSYGQNMKHNIALVARCRWLASSFVAAYGPQSSLGNPRVPLSPVPDMAKDVGRAFEIPIRTLGLAGLGMRRRG